MDISIIIPTVDDEIAMREQLQRLPRLIDPHAVEIIVVDGGSVDGTCALGAELGRVIFAPPGRSVQLNAGAAAARGETLLFLQPETLLPPDAIAALRRTARRGDVVGGAFRKAPGRRSILLWLADMITSLRLDIHLSLYADRAMFVRRRAFVQCGGFDERLTVMEDVDLGRRLRRFGRLAQVPASVRTSERRSASRVPQTLFMRAAVEVGWRLGLDVSPLARHSRP